MQYIIPLSHNAVINNKVSFHHTCVDGKWTWLKVGTDCNKWTYEWTDSISLPLQTCFVAARLIITHATMPLKLGKKDIT